MADDPINDYLSDNGMGEYIPDYETFSGPSTIEEYWAEQGLVEKEVEGFDAAPPAPVAEEVEEEKSGFLYDVGQMRGPQFAGNLIRGAITPLSSIPKQLGIFAANLNYATGLEGIDAREGALYKLGEGMDWIGEAVTPDRNEAFEGEFGTEVAPQAIGNMFGMVFGTRGIGGMAAGSKAVTGLSRQSAAKAAGAAKQRIATKAAELGAKRGSAVSPSVIRQTANKAARKDIAKMSQRYKNITYGAVGVEIGSAQAMVGGWEDAMNVLENKARAEGRELTDEERTMAYQSYWANSFIGISEVLPVWKLLKHLDGVVPQSKSRIFEAIKTGGYEAAQEFAQSVYGNHVAAHMVGYDKGRKLLEGAGIASGAGGVAGAVMGLLTFTLGRRVRLEQDIRKLEQEAADATANNMPKVAEMKTIQANQLRKQLDRYDKESGAVAERGREEAAAQPATEGEAAAPAETAGILNPQRRYQQGDAVDVVAAESAEPAVEPAAEPAVAEVTPAVVEETEAPAPAAEEATETLAEDVREQVADEFEQGWQEVEAQVQKNVSEELVQQAKDAGVEPASIRRTKAKNPKITAKAVRDAIADKRRADETQQARVDLAEAATPAPQEEVAEEPSPLADEAAPLPTAEVGAEPAVPTMPTAETDPAPLTEDSVEDFEQDYEQVAGRDGRFFTLASQPNGKVSIEVNEQPLANGRHMTREEAVELIESQDLNAEYDNNVADLGDPAVDPSTPEGQQELQEREAEQQSEEAEQQERDTEADARQERIDTVNRISIGNGRAVVVVEAGVDPSSPEVDKAIEAAFAAYESGAAALGFKGDPQNPIELRFQEGWSEDRGPMFADPANLDGGQNTIYIGVSNINNAVSKGNYDLSLVASEEIWHVIEGQALLESFIQDPKADIRLWPQYYTKTYTDIFDSMTDAEVNEAVSTYFPRENREAGRDASADNIARMKREGGKDWDRFRLTVASEYTRIRGQQALAGQITEQNYSNRDIAPVMHSMLRKVYQYINRLIGEGNWVEASTSSEASKRVKETEAMIKLLGGLRSVKDAEAKAEQLSKLMEQEVEDGTDDFTDTALRSAPADVPTFPTNDFWLGPKGEIIELSGVGMDRDVHEAALRSNLSGRDLNKLMQIADDLVQRDLLNPDSGVETEADAYEESMSGGGGFRIELKTKYIIAAANKMGWVRAAHSGVDALSIEGNPNPIQDRILEANASGSAGSGVNRSRRMSVYKENPKNPSMTARLRPYKGMDYGEDTVIRSGAGSLPTNSAFWMVKDGSFIDMKEKGAQHVPSLMKYLAGKSKAMVEELKKLTKAEAQKEVDDPDEPATTLRQTMMPVGKGRKMDFSDEHYIAAANRMGFVRVVRFNNQIQIEGSPNKTQLAQLEDDAFERGVDVTDQTTGRTIIRGSEGRGDRGMVEDSRFTAWSAVGDDVKIKRIQDASKVLNTPANSFTIRKAIEQPRSDLTSEQVTTVINSLRLYHGTDLMTIQMIRESGFMAGRVGKVGGGIYFAPDRDTNVFGDRSQPSQFARDKGDGEIMEVIADFSLIINGDQLVADDSGELTKEARDVLEAVGAIGGVNGFDGTPEEIFEDVLKIERWENANDDQVNMNLWEMIGRLGENFITDPFIPDFVKPNKDTLSTDYDLKVFLKEMLGYEGITFYSGLISDGKNMNPMAGREVVAFRSIEEHLTRNYIRENLFEEVDGEQQVRSGVSERMLNNNGESPVAPVPFEKSVLGTIVRVMSPHRWAIGGEDLLRRAGLNNLADSLREFYDAEAILLGRFFDGYRELQERYTYDEWETAKTEFSRYMAMREQGQKEEGDGQKFREQAEAMLEGTSPATKELVAWQKSIATQTGMLSKELNVHVYDPSMQKGKGGWRPIGNLGEWHFPRMFKQETFDIITNRNLPEFKDKYRTLLNDMVANGNAETVEEAHEALQQNYKDTTGGDYFANLERARGTKLPDRYYDNSVDAYLHFLRRYSERTAQIQAFGQRMDGRVKDAWDVAKDEVGDQQLAEDIDLIQKTVYRQRPKWEGWQNVASWGTGISSMLYLSGPLTSMRNLTSALRMNMESFGFLNTAGALGKSLLQSIKATAITAQKITAGEWTAKFWKEGAKTATPEMVAEAHAMGALRMDFQTAQLLDLYEDSPWYDSKSAKAMLVKGNTMALWMHGATERMGRSISYAAGLQWLRATRELVANESGDYKRRLALMKRLGFHTEADRQAVLSGDPVEVQRFLRATVREKQYSYDISQSPLFFASPVGRMFFQFQKWGYQRLRDLGRNVISPALGGGKVYYKGKELQVERDFKPLLRMAILSMGAGELYAFLRSLLTDRERKEAGFGEIAETYNVDEQRGMALAFERIANNFVLDGGSGIIGDYYQLSKDMATRGWRYKNPLEPPTIQTGKEIVGLVTDRFTRKSLTEGMGRDLKDFFMRLPVLRQPPLSTMVDGVMDNTVDDDWSSRKDAMNQVGKLRNAARRFADEYELDEERSMNFIMDAKNPNSYLYDSIHDALLVGDFERARELRKEAIEKASPKDRKRKLLAIKTSVRNRQPLKVGGVENEKVRTAFYKWLKERRPDEAANLMQVQRRYLVTAARAGLR